MFARHRQQSSTGVTGPAASTSGPPSAMGQPQQVSPGQLLYKEPDSFNAQQTTNNSSSYGYAQNPNGFPQQQQQQQYQQQFQEPYRQQTLPDQQQQQQPPETEIIRQSSFTGLPPVRRTSTLHFDMSSLMTGEGKGKGPEGSLTADGDTGANQVPPVPTLPNGPIQGYQYQPQQTQQPQQPQQYQQPQRFDGPSNSAVASPTSGHKRQFSWNSQQQGNSGAFTYQPNGVVQQQQWPGQTVTQNNVQQSPPAQHRQLPSRQQQQQPPQQSQPEVPPQPQEQTIGTMSTEASDTAGNPIQKLPPQGPWKLEESHLQEPLAAARQRSSPTSNPEEQYYPFDKETGAPLDESTLDRPGTATLPSSPPTPPVPTEPLPTAPLPSGAAALVNTNGVQQPTEQRQLQPQQQAGAGFAPESAPPHSRQPLQVHQVTGQPLAPGGQQQQFQPQQQQQFRQQQQFGQQQPLPLQQQHQPQPLQQLRPVQQQGVRDPGQQLTGGPPPVAANGGAENDKQPWRLSKIAGWRGSMHGTPPPSSHSAFAPPGSSHGAAPSQLQHQPSQQQLQQQQQPQQQTAQQIYQQSGKKLRNLLAFSKSKATGHQQEHAQTAAAAPPVQQFPQNQPSTAPNGFVQGAPLGYQGQPRQVPPGQQPQRLQQQAGPQGFPGQAVGAPNQGQFQQAQAFGPQGQPIRGQAPGQPGQPGFPGQAVQGQQQQQAYTQGQPQLQQRPGQQGSSPSQGQFASSPAGQQGPQGPQGPPLQGPLASQSPRGSFQYTRGRVGLPAANGSPLSAGPSPNGIQPQSAPNSFGPPGQSPQGIQGIQHHATVPLPHQVKRSETFGAIVSPDGFVEDKSNRRGSNLLSGFFGKAKDKSKAAWAASQQQQPQQQQPPQAAPGAPRPSSQFYAPGQAPPNSSYGPQQQQGPGQFNNLQRSPAGQSPADAQSLSVGPAGRPRASSNTPSINRQQQPARPSIQEDGPAHPFAEGSRPPQSPSPLSVTGVQAHSAVEPAAGQGQNQAPGQGQHSAGPSISSPLATTPAIEREITPLSAVRNGHSTSPASTRNSVIPPPASSSPPGEATSPASFTAVPTARGRLPSASLAGVPRKPVGSNASPVSTSSDNQQRLFQQPSRQQLNQPVGGDATPQSETQTPIQRHSPKPDSLPSPRSIAQSIDRPPSAMSDATASGATAGMSAPGNAPHARAVGHRDSSTPSIATSISQVTPDGAAPSTSPAPPNQQQFQRPQPIPEKGKGPANFQAAGVPRAQTFQPGAEPGQPSQPGQQPQQPQPYLQQSQRLQQQQPLPPQQQQFLQQSGAAAPNQGGFRGQTGPVQGQQPFAQQSGVPAGQATPATAQPKLEFAKKLFGRFRGAKQPAAAVEPQGPPPGGPQYPPGLTPAPLRVNKMADSPSPTASVGRPNSARPSIQQEQPLQVQGQFGQQRQAQPQPQTQFAGGPQQQPGTAPGQLSPNPAAAVSINPNVAREQALKQQISPSETRAPQHQAAFGGQASSAGSPAGAAAPGAQQAQQRPIQQQQPQQAPLQGAAPAAPPAGLAAATAAAVASPSRSSPFGSIYRHQSQSQQQTPHVEPQYGQVPIPRGYTYVHGDGTPYQTPASASPAAAAFPQQQQPQPLQLQQQQLQQQHMLQQQQQRQFQQQQQLQRQQQQQLQPQLQQPQQPQQQGQPQLQQQPAFNASQYPMTNGYRQQVAVAQPQQPQQFQPQPQAQMQQPQVQGQQFQPQVQHQVQPQVLLQQPQTHPAQQTQQFQQQPQQQPQFQQQQFQQQQARQQWPQAAGQPQPSFPGQGPVQQGQRMVQQPIQQAPVQQQPVQPQPLQHLAQNNAQAGPFPGQLPSQVQNQAPGQVPQQVPQQVPLAGTPPAQNQFAVAPQPQRAVSQSQAVPQQAEHHIPTTLAVGAAATAAVAGVAAASGLSSRSESQSPSHPLQQNPVAHSAGHTPPPVSAPTTAHDDNESAVIDDHDDDSIAPLKTISPQDEPRQYYGPDDLEQTRVVSVVSTTDTPVSSIHNSPEPVRLQLYENETITSEDDGTDSTIMPPPLRIQSPIRTSPEPSREPSTIVYPAEETAPAAPTQKAQVPAPIETTIVHDTNGLQSPALDEEDAYAATPPPLHSAKAVEYAQAKVVAYKPASVRTDSSDSGVGGGMTAAAGAAGAAAIITGAVITVSGTGSGKQSPTKVAETNPVQSEVVYATPPPAIQPDTAAAAREINVEAEPQQQPATKDSPVKDQPIVVQAPVEPTSVQTDTVQPIIVQPATVQPAIVQPVAVQPDGQMDARLKEHMESLVSPADTPTLRVDGITSAVGSSSSKAAENDEAVTPPSPVDGLDYEFPLTAPSATGGLVIPAIPGDSGDSSGVERQKTIRQTSQQQFEDYKRRQMLKDLEEKIPVFVPEHDSELEQQKKKEQEEPKMTATSYPGQEWNPYDEFAFGEDD